MDRKEYIIKTYGCSELSWEHWDIQDKLHNGHIPGTASEKVARETVAPKKTKSKKENRHVQRNYTYEWRG